MSSDDKSPVSQDADGPPSLRHGASGSGHSLVPRGMTAAEPTLDPGSAQTTTVSGQIVPSSQGASEILELVGRFHSIISLGEGGEASTVELVPSLLAVTVPGLAEIKVDTKTSTTVGLNLLATYRSMLSARSDTLIRSPAQTSERDGILTSVDSLSERLKSAEPRQRRWRRQPSEPTLSPDDVKDVDKIRDKILHLCGASGNVQ